MNEGQTIRLLIAEDNVADVLLMSEALRDLCSVPVQITTAADGERALSLLTSGAQFDVVILDLSLPKVSGFKVLEKYQPKYPPTVVFSSSWNEDDSKLAL